MRLRCVLFGCCTGAMVPCCERCDAHVYDDDFLQFGLLTPTICRVHTALARIVGRPCEVCGKRIWWATDDDWTCSPACHDQWIPF